MKKLIIGLTACALGVALLGCTASNSSIGHCLDARMNDLQNTINSMSSISTQDLSLVENDQPEVQETAILQNGFGGNIYGGNVNTYGFPSFGYGFNPYLMNGAMGYGTFAGFNPYMYGMQNIAGFNGAYNPIYNNANAFGRFHSNIDTYRINQVTKDGKTSTTIDSYHNGKPVDHKEFTESDEDNPEIEQTNALQNLQNLCNNCQFSNNFGNQLKTEILNNIAEVNKLSNSIKNYELNLDNNQVKNMNEYLDNIAHTESKLNMEKGEFNRSLDQVKNTKADYEVNPININTKYIKLLSCMDTRNSYLQNILNSLLQMENCIDGNCQNGLCWNGICFNPNMNNPDSTCSNCTNCPDCATCNDCNSCGTCSSCSTCNNCSTCNGCVDCKTCTDCLFCTDCENCTNCFNCFNCKNCSNLANVSGYDGNKPCPNCDNTLPTENNSTTQTVDQTALLNQETDNEISVDNNILDDTSENGEFLNENDITSPSNTEILPNTQVLPASDNNEEILEHEGLPIKSYENN